MTRALVRRSAAVFFGLGGACIWLGCNAIAGIQLGTLETTANDSGMSGGNDATTGAGDGGASVDSGGSPRADGGTSDGGSGVDAATYQTYSCTTSSTAPFLVANLESSDAGRSFDTRITLGITSNQQARIVVDVEGNPSMGNQPSEVFRSYDVQWNPKQVDDTVPFVAMPGSHLAGAVSTPNGITAIVTQGFFSNDGGSSTVVSAYPLPANQQNLFSAPQPYPLTQPVFGFNQGATALEMGLNDQFLVTNNGPLQSNRATLDGGPTTPTTFAPMGPTQGGSDATLVHGGTSVYAVYGGDPTSDASTLIYKIPDNGVNAGAVAPSILPPGLLVAAAQQSTVDPTKIATYGATLVTAPTAMFTLYSGLVDATSFDQLQYASLTAGPSLMLHEVPANKGTSVFLGDSLVLLGLSPVSSDNGLNFVWVDAHGHLLAKAVGDTRLYNTRPGIQASAIAPVENVASILTTFFVAWIEEQTDGAGPYDLLYLDQVQCAAN
jgi:hypothetical protein